MRKNINYKENSNMKSTLNHEKKIKKIVVEQNYKIKIMKKKDCRI